MQRKFTIADIKAANAKAGLHFFDRDTMRGFNSQVEPYVYQGPGGVCLVTSEQFQDGAYKADRKWTVREFNPETGSVKTVGEFNKLDRETAREWASDYAKGGDL